MEFSIKERLVLGASLGGLKGNIARIRILRKLREDFSFSEEEFERFELRREGENFVWRLDAEESKEIEIGDEARKIIVERLKELNQKEELAEDHLDIIDRFPEVEDGTLVLSGKA